MDLSELLISEVQKRPALWNLRGKAYHNRVIVERDWKKVAEITGLTVGASKVRWKNLRDHFRKELLKQQKPNPEGGEQRLSKWIHFDSLLFLRLVLKPRRSKGKPPTIAEGIPEVNPAETEAASIDVDNDGDSGGFEFSQTGAAVNAVSVDEKEQLTVAAAQTPAFNLAAMPTNRTYKREAKDSSATEITSPFESPLVVKMESDKVSLMQPLEDDDLNFLKSLLPYMKSLPPIRKLMIRSQFQNLLAQEMINLQNNTSTLHAPSNSGVQLSPEDISSPGQE